MEREDAVVAMSPTVDRAYVTVAVAAAVLAVAQGPRTPLVLACVGLALLPWAWAAVGRPLPLGAFAALGVLPLVPVVLVSGIGGGLFLTTAVASRVASRTDDRRLVVVVAAAVCLLPFAAYATGEGDHGAVYFAFGDLFGVLAGVLLRRTAVLAAGLRVAQEELAEAARRQERLRIARDVHDLVAHSLTVVVLHVGGARRVLRTDPDTAEQALREAEEVARQSLDGVRGVVGLLRDDGSEHRPVLSLDLAELVGTYRTAGLDVGLDVAGDPAALPLDVRVTLHRVVQEALANASRYGGPCARVEVCAGSGGVDVRVSSAGRTGPATPGGGFGLVGLQEQVSAVGGSLHSGPAGDGWVVDCRLGAAVRR